MKNILVTGGAGFIGSNLVEELVNQGHDVTVVDNLVSGNTENLTDVINKITFVEEDICTIDFSELLEQDEIYHLACQASPPRYQKDPLHTLDTCYIGTKNVLEAARMWNVPVLFSSTSEIYGEPIEHPQSENYRGNVSTVTPRSCYDEGKRIAETLCYEYSKYIPIKLARIFNTYGPKMDPEDGRVVSNFIWQAINGDALTVYGHGSQTRSLCYVSDNIRALQTFMQQDTGNLKVLNIGNDDELTILDLAKLINHYFESNVAIEFCPLPEADPTKRKPDLRQAYKALNWEPEITLDDGLQETIAYFNNKNRTAGLFKNRAPM